MLPHDRTVRRRGAVVVDTDRLGLRSKATHRAAVASEERDARGVELMLVHCVFLSVGYVVIIHPTAVQRNP